jgi:hypothetical protein
VTKKEIEMLEKMSRRVFIEALKSGEFLTTEQAIARLDKRNFWNEGAIESAILEWKKSYVRKAMRQIKDARGRPVFANVEITNDEGETVHGYMQQELFEVAHYKQVIQYHVDRAKHHINEAHEYAKDLDHRYSVQIELPFPLPAEERAA